jgi:hypothetical protein
VGDWADYYVDGPGFDPLMDGGRPYGRNGKLKSKRKVSFTLNAAEEAAYKAIGGAAAVRKLILAAQTTLKEPQA